MKLDAPHFLQIKYKGLAEYFALSLAIERLFFINPVQSFFRHTIFLGI